MSLTKRENSLIQLFHESAEQRDAIIKREAQLTAYGQNILSKSREVKKRSNAVEIRLEKLKRSYARDERDLLRAIEQGDATIEKIENRRVSLNRHRMETERRISELERDSQGLTQLDDTYKDRIEGLRNEASENVLYEIQQRIRDVRHAIHELTGEHKCVLESMLVRDSDLHKVRQTSNDVNMKMQIRREELDHMVGERTRYVPVMQFQMQQASSVLSAMKRKEMRHSEKKMVIIARMQQVSQRMSRVSANVDACNVEVERNVTQAALREKELRWNESVKAELKFSLETLRDNVTAQREKGSTASKQVAYMQGQLLLVQNEKNQTEIELVKMQRQLHDQTVWIEESGTNVNIFARISVEIERQMRKSAELDRQAETTAAVTPTPVEESSEVSQLKEEWATRVRALESDTEKERSQINEMKQVIAEANLEHQERSDQYRGTADAMASVTIETKHLFPGSTDTRTTEREIGLKREQRSKKLDMLRAKIQQMSERSAELREALASSRNSMSQRRTEMAEQLQIITNGGEPTPSHKNNGQVTEEQQVGVASLERVLEALSDEPRIWQQINTIDDAQKRLNEWLGKVSDFYENLDSFYLR